MAVWGGAQIRIWQAMEAALGSRAAFNRAWLSPTHEVRSEEAHSISGEQIRASSRRLLQLKGFKVRIGSENSHPGPPRGEGRREGEGTTGRPWVP